MLRVASPLLFEKMQFGNEKFYHTLIVAAIPNSKPNLTGFGIILCKRLVALLKIRLN
jgi:hypothetical protein